MKRSAGQITNDERRMASYSIREPLEALLSARPDGLGEAMLVHLLRVEDDMPLGRAAPAYCVTDEDPWIRKVRHTCRQAGARRDEQGVWRLAA